MLDAARDRIHDLAGRHGLVLDVSGHTAPLARADYVLTDEPYESRGHAEGDGSLHFSKRTWVVRDPCAREPWPFQTGQFDLAVCVGSLAVVRDPIWVCAELTRVARAGYVEVPTIEHELAYGIEGPWSGDAASRWLCEAKAGELVFVHKPHSLHHDWTLRAPLTRLNAADHVQGLFWESALPARERRVDDDELLALLRERLEERFTTSLAEVRLRQAGGIAQQLAGLVRRPIADVLGYVSSSVRGRP